MKSAKELIISLSLGENLFNHIPVFAALAGIFILVMEIFFINDISVNDIIISILSMSINIIEIKLNWHSQPQYKPSRFKMDDKLEYEFTKEVTEASIKAVESINFFFLVFDNMLLLTIACLIFIIYELFMFYTLDSNLLKAI